MITVTTEKMKKIDEFAIQHLKIPSLELMEAAAQKLTDEVVRSLKTISDPQVQIVCGTGNNGGDGFACARLLAERGFSVDVILVGDPLKCTRDSLENQRRLHSMNVPIHSYSGVLNDEADCIVDAVFGFGLNREVTGVLKDLIKQMNTHSAYVVACDIPSGLNGNTGIPMGISVKADKTVTFTAVKQGLLNPNSVEYVGELVVADIGIPKEVISNINGNYKE